MYIILPIMGIKNLNFLIEKYSSKGIKKTHLSTYFGKTIAIDANIYMYKYLYGKSNHLNGFFFQINKLKKYNITPIYVFDGKSSEDKLNTIEKRKCTRQKLKVQVYELKTQLNNMLKENIGNNSEKIKLMNDISLRISKLENRIINVVPDNYDKLKTLLDLMSIKYIDAPGEAEHYCSLLTKMNYVDAVMSEDMDNLACGCKILIKKFSNREDYVYEYNLENILSNLGLNHDEFIDMCILCGNDYINRLKSLQIDNIYLLIKNNKRIENLLEKNLIIPNSNFIYQISRNIYNLKGVYLDNEILSNLKKNKDPEIDKLKLFILDYTDIDKNVFEFRINKMFKIKNFQNIEFKNTCKENKYLNNLKLRY